MSSVETNDQRQTDSHPPLFDVRDLHIEFRGPEGRVPVVQGVSFQIEQGRTLALVGESGSGKSVISQAIMGILPYNAWITGGNIYFTDPAFANNTAINNTAQSSRWPHDSRNHHATLDIARLNPKGKVMRSLQGGRLSIIFQEPMTSLSPLHTVGDQIIEAIQLHDTVYGKASQKRAEEMLELVGFPDARRALNTYPFELSGGLRQRVMIAMALVCRPALLIADEPTTALDVTIQAQILKLLIDLQAQFKMAVLMITHDLGVVANIADSVVVLYHGQVMEAGSAQRLYSNPQHSYLKALFQAVPRFHMQPGERLTPIRSIDCTLTGHLASNVSDTRPKPAADEPLLTLDRLGKHYHLRKNGLFSGTKAALKVVAVEDFSLIIRRGECLGLVGESGCGKTTLSRMLTRALTPNQGRVLLHSADGTQDIHQIVGADLKKFRQKLQLVFQDPFASLNPRMTVFDLISEPLIIHQIGTHQDRVRIVQDLMKAVGLDGRYMQRYPHSFSGGQRQRISIARSLALKPDLLLLDEPVSALDVSIQAQILNLLVDLKNQLGLTYLFISHNLAVVNYIADRIAVMCAGRLVEIAPRASLFASPYHPYTQALLAAIPEPNLSHRLDFSKLMDERASKPALWPHPYTITDSNQTRLVEIAPAHFVRCGSDSK